MEMLEIDENEFINLNKVIRLKIKENRLVGHRVNEHDENDHTIPITSGYRVEFELDNNFLISSKIFATVEDAKMWLYDHSK